MHTSQRHTYPNIHSAFSYKHLSGAGSTPRAQKLCTKRSDPPLGVRLFSKHLLCNNNVCRSVSAIRQPSLPPSPPPSTPPTPTNRPLPFLTGDVGRAHLHALPAAAARSQHTQCHTVTHCCRHSTTTSSSSTASKVCCAVGEALRLQLSHAHHLRQPMAAAAGAAAAAATTAPCAPAASSCPAAADKAGPSLWCRAAAREPQSLPVLLPTLPPHQFAEALKALAVALAQRQVRSSLMAMTNS